MKYFALKGDLDSRSNPCNIQQSNVCKSTAKGYARHLAQAVGNSF